MAAGKALLLTFILVLFTPGTAFPENEAVTAREDDGVRSYIITLFIIITFYNYNIL